MNKITASLFFTLLTSFSVCLSADSVPELLSYQGRITGPGGTPVGASAPVNRLMVFSFFDAPTGGTRVWTEKQYANIYKGEFTVLLGNGTAVSTYPRELLSKVFAASGASLYLEVTVDAGGDGAIDPANTSADPPILPRQRMVSTGYAFRARSADSITPGTDLRFLSTDDPTTADYGLGFYNSTRQFNNVDVNGPVLFGQNGGALGSSSGGTQSLAVSWLANGNVGIGEAAPTERLHVNGNIKATGSLTLGSGITATGSITATNGVTSGAINSTGAVTGTTLTGTSLSIRATGSATELAGITEQGAINLTRGGTINGPAGNELNIDSVGRITIKDITITGSLDLPAGANFGAVQVLQAQKRLVLGGATGWGSSVASTVSAPTAGANTTTGMRLVFAGTDPASTLVGMGMETAEKLFTVAPASGQTRWYGGTQVIMSLDNATGELSPRNLKVLNTKGNLLVEGTNSARLLLTAGSAGAGLALTNRDTGVADLTWVKVTDSTEMPMMTFKRTTTDAQISDTVADMGYVGINVANPKAPLHVKAHLERRIATPPHNLEPDSGPTFSTATTGDMTLDGIPLGNAGIANWGTYSNTYGDGKTLLYQYLSAIFDGELISRRMWFGDNLDTASDARAKQILGLSDSAKDMATLMKLKVTDYQWIDRSLDQHRPHKRLIAQQVGEAFPQAVSFAPVPQAIPNVYELATELKHDAASGTLTITTKKAHDLKKGDRVDLVSDHAKMKETPVKEVLSAHTFVIDCKQPLQSLFVYGKYVNDFHTVDYDAISMLNVSATQRLKQEHDDLTDENAVLRAEVAALEKELAAREAAQRETDARFESLEARLRGKPSSPPARAPKTAALKPAIATP